MTAPWDRRSHEKHERVAALALRQWLPTATSFTAPGIVGEVVEQARQPEVLAPDGVERHFDVRTSGAVVGSPFVEVR